jgi:hypothetical protein
MLKRAVDMSYILGFMVGKHNDIELMISHLLFADETLVLCEADSQQIRHLQGVFIWF